MKTADELDRMADELLLARRRLKAGEAKSIPEPERPIVVSPKTAARVVLIVGTGIDPATKDPDDAGHESG